MLKSATGWMPENLKGIDAYGFSALPAGGSSGFSGTILYGSAVFWSTTWVDKPNGVRCYHRMYLDYYHPGDVGLTESCSNDNLSSVRCVKD